MSDISISMRGVGKCYRTGSMDTYKTLRDRLVSIVKRDQKPASKKELWAVRDVDLDVREGEVLGIIGSNGAGKSTLLKLLTRITRPDTGAIELSGRVGALLEVGTGFHPELSGRENIYMNGAILGMSRQTIDRHFDQIVGFSGIDTAYVDTPVKRYSSGMRVRLGFSVAAHLEPEILVIDEVLAVGDAAFQKRCLGRMDETAKSGRTVLFVSHQMEAIQALCSRAIWMKHGEVAMSGKPTEVIGEYLNFAIASAKTALADRTDRQGAGRVRVTAFEVCDDRGRPNVRTGDVVTFRVVLRSEQEGLAEMRLFVVDPLEKPLTMLANENTGDMIQLKKGENVWECVVPSLPLVPGPYLLSFALRVNGQVQDKFNRAHSFDVHPGNFFAATNNEHAGVMHVPHLWKAA